MTMKLAHRISAMSPWLDGVAGVIKQIWTPLLGSEAPRTPRDLLYGTWLGHPLHPAVVLAPIGCWTSALVCDIAGEERAADLGIKLGLGSSLLATASGAAQWLDVTEDERANRIGALHATINTAATALYGASWLFRSNGARGAGIACSTAGYGVLLAGAWLGGDLAYDLGIGINRIAFEEPPSNWTDVLAEDELGDGTPRRVEADGTPVMLLRRGDEIFAIAAVCTHVGGPLDEGKLEGETVTCPWHGSVFSLRDGALLHGPATFSERAYEVRRRDGRIAVRPVTA